MVYYICRPPSSSKHRVEFSTLLTDFQSFLTVAANTPINFIITADVNIHIKKESETNRIRFMEILDLFNLPQLVSVATHIEHNTLDLVIVSSDSLVTAFDMPTILPCPPVMPSVRYVKSINREDFNHDLASKPLITEPPSTLDELLECCNATLTRLLNKHAPLINKPAPSRPFNPWFTPFLSGLKATRRWLEKVWLKSKDSYHLMYLRQISNFYHHSVVLAKQAYNTSLINDCKSQPRKL